MYITYIINVVRLFRAFLSLAVVSPTLGLRTASMSWHKASWRAGQAGDVCQFRPSLSCSQRRHTRHQDCLHLWTIYGTSWYITVHGMWCTKIKLYFTDLHSVSSNAFHFCRCTSTIFLAWIAHLDCWRCAFDAHLVQTFAATYVPVDSTMPTYLFTDWIWLNHDWILVLHWHQIW